MCLPFSLHPNPFRTNLMERKLCFFTATFSAQTLKRSIHSVCVCVCPTNTYLVLVDRQWTVHHYSVFLVVIFKTSPLDCKYKKLP